MIAKRFAIIEAVEAAMDSLSQVMEVQINSSGDPSRFPAVFIDDIGHRPDVGTEPGVTRYDFSLVVEGYVEGAGGKAVTAQINALYLAVVEKLLSDPGIENLVEEINEGAARFDVATLASKRRSGFSMDWDIIFAADRISPVAD